MAKKKARPSPWHYKPKVAAKMKLLKKQRRTYRYRSQMADPIEAAAIREGNAAAAKRYRAKKSESATTKATGGAR